MFNGKIHYKWPFSIAMLNYQRVMLDLRRLSSNIVMFVDMVAPVAKKFSELCELKNWETDWSFLLVDQPN